MNQMLQARGWTAADLVARFGPLPLERMRQPPTPGTATEEDVERLDRKGERLCELIEGFLLEKTVGYEESLIAAILIIRLGRFVEKHRLGRVSGEAGMLRFAPGLILIPDVAFVSYERLPKGKRARGPAAPDLVPDLAVEVLSEGNTREEMEQKLRRYFDAGVRLVWYVDPDRSEVRVYTSVRKHKKLGRKDTLDGGDVLPGFKMPVRKLFEDLED